MVELPPVVVEKVARRDLILVRVVGIVGSYWPTTSPRGVDLPQPLHLREVGLSYSRFRIVEELLLPPGVARGFVYYLLS
jgi:hypothetical protein